MELGASPLKLDLIYCKQLPYLAGGNVRWLKLSAIMFLLPFLLFGFSCYSKYLQKCSQSNRQQHQQTCLLKQMEENQQSAQTTPQNYKQKGRNTETL